MPATDINLLPQLDFSRNPFGKLLYWSLTYGRYIIVCTEIIVLLAFIYRFSLDRKITDLNEEIEQKAAIIEANQKFESQFRHLQSRVAEIGNLSTDVDLSLAIIKHLESITPKGIVYTQFSFSGDSVTISAVTNTDVNLALFIYMLKSSDLLSQITIGSLNKQTAGTSQITFQVNAKVQVSNQNLISSEFKNTDVNLSFNSN